jgi:UDPglucose 6-dehydrogenase
MKIAVVGSGYVGLVTGACFAERGNTVTCVDIDEKKINLLKNGKSPIYEPGLEELIRRNAQENRLIFTTSLADAMQTSDVIFIAVGTPPGEDGSADLQYVLAVAKEVGRYMNKYCVVVDKSTVPVGTADKVKQTIQKELDQRGAKIEFAVVSNPEFLKEGAAIDDFMKPDRVIVGVDDEKAERIMHDLYLPFMRHHEKVMMMGIRDAEMTKYAANSLLATKISFMNEIANLCDQLGVDIENVRKGIGSDSRIGYSFIYAGCGYGGSCFPKDVQALIRMANDYDYDALILRSVEERNRLQKLLLAEKIKTRFGDDLSELTFGVWGLSFKPGTDDMRDAPSKVILHELIAAGAKVVAYDPVASEVAKQELPQEWFTHEHIKLVEHQYDVLQDANALILITEWKPFHNPDFDKMKQLMKQPIIFDGRNQYEPEHVRNLGFEYFTIGRDSQV